MSTANGKDAKGEAGKAEKRKEAKAAPQAEAKEGAASTASPSAAAPATDPAATPSSFLGAYFHRARTLTDKHPAGIVFTAAGAGVLYAAEFTVGALDGIAGSRLFRTTSAPEIREQIRREREELVRETRERRDQLKQQGEKLFERGKTQGGQLFERGKAQGEQLLRRGRSLWPFHRRPDQNAQTP